MFSEPVFEKYLVVSKLFFNCKYLMNGLELGVEIRNLKDSHAHVEYVFQVDIA